MGLLPLTLSSLGAIAALYCPAWAPAFCLNFIGRDKVSPASAMGAPSFLVSATVWANNRRLVLAHFYLLGGALL
jgi:hypothetical protein